LRPNERADGLSAGRFATQMTKLRTAIEVLLLALIAAFLAAIALGVFVDLFWSPDSKPSESFRGAFLGAFFAFLFVRIGDALTRIYERQAKGRQALIALQHRFQDLLNVLNDNLFVFQSIETFAAALKIIPPAPILFSKFQKLPVVGDLLLPLTNIDLINELKGIDIEINKWNDSVETWHRSYDHMQDAFIGKSIDLQTYVVNARKACETADRELKMFAQALQQDLVRAAAAIRLLAEKDTVLGNVIRWTTQDHYPRDFDLAREAEREKMEKEVADGTRGTGTLTAVQRMRNERELGQGTSSGTKKAQ
jgi:hypothetical protein